ncbi:protein of unknown function [Arachidicoccus rhizosphaerae]|uniref:DUF4835 domain-containing protein n=1 Tax=Arachidicoccus rhizosphaerae TaxID=551991 RepID=A0A1H3WY12_9BACT|nr:DUF4835 family protein [Arachidicoccus rhizosphaerae]SDZ92087.1 protein of unknown function [Arachidicoccus rhizosphaerae]
MGVANPHTGKAFDNKNIARTVLCKSVMVICLLFTMLSAAYSQELNAQVTVVAPELGTTIDASLITNLQKQLTDFINQRKWTTDQFQPEEKINCNFAIALTGIASQDVYEARLTVQAARPVYNSVYQSVLVNYQDGQFIFKYRPYQRLEFNPSQVAGTDALAANLTATIAYYINIILGLDYDSFEQGKGMPFFKNAQSIVVGAPRASNIKGWQSFDGQRNRYYLSSNLTAAGMEDMHKVIYKYFRSGLDSMYSHPTQARAQVLEALRTLQKFNQAHPNTMIEQFFMESRTDELVGIFKQAAPEIKADALSVLTQLNPNGANTFNEELKN